MLSPTYEITTALSHTDELISPPYDIAIVTISYGRVTMSSVWDSMMSKKNMGWPFYAAVGLSGFVLLCHFFVEWCDKLFFVWGWGICILDSPCSSISLLDHDDVIKGKHFPRNWPFVQGIHRSPVNSPHKGQWRGALMFSLICTWINGWVNNHEAGDLRSHGAHYDVTVMWSDRAAGGPTHHSFYYNYPPPPIPKQHVSLQLMICCCMNSTITSCNGYLFCQ